MGKTKSLAGLIVLAVSLPSYGVHFSSILPTNRSVQVGSPASFFGTMLNASASEARNCAIFLESPIDAWFSYQATDAGTNAPIGTINTPVSIPANSSQSFVLVLTPNSVIAPVDVRFTYSCEGAQDVADIDGINTLLFSASSQPVPDVVALASTASANGIVELVQDEIGFFTLSSTNIGTNGTFEVTPRVTGADYINVTICQTDPSTSICVSDPKPTVNVAIENGETPTFALFLTTPSLIELDAAAHRVFVEFRDASREVRGSTSVAVFSSESAAADSVSAPAPEPVADRTIRVTWQPPAQNLGVLAAYGIHIGTQSGRYTESVFVSPQETAIDIAVAKGMLYLSMTSELASGGRSAYSSELEILID